MWGVGVTKAQVILYSCHNQGGNQQWTFQAEDGTFRHPASRWQEGGPSSICQEVSDNLG